MSGPVGIHAPLMPPLATLYAAPVVSGQHALSQPQTGRDSATQGLPQQFSAEQTREPHAGP